MKFNLLIICMVVTYNFAYATQCLSASELKELNNIYQNSGQFYGHVKLDCHSTSEINYWYKNQNRHESHN